VSNKKSSIAHAAIQQILKREGNNFTIFLSFLAWEVGGFKGESGILSF
jgi:hypothetical protein